MPYPVYNNEPILVIFSYSYLYFHFLHTILRSHSKRACFATCQTSYTIRNFSFAHALSAPLPGKARHSSLYRCSFFHMIILSRQIIPVSDRLNSLMLLRSLPFGTRPWLPRRRVPVRSSIHPVPAWHKAACLSSLQRRR